LRDFQCQFGIKRVQIHPPILQQTRRSAIRFQQVIVGDDVRSL
jgi:hypothetical protein